VSEYTSDFVAGDDGYYVFWPTTNNGAYTARNLRALADELDRRNEKIDALLKEADQ
jgi:hypothetical protein